MTEHCSNSAEARARRLILSRVYLSLVVLGLIVVGYAHWPWGSRLAAQAREDSPAAERHRMVEEQIKARGVKDEKVLAALLKVPRERFVPSGVAPQAYADRPLPIGYGQTISQPFIVAYMTEALQVTAKMKVLEIGTGSGYQAAVLGELTREVYTIEIVPQLADRARDTLAALGYRHVHVRTGDGYLGWPERAPFDAIMVTAAPDHVPQPLVDQLAIGGRMIIPVGVAFQDMLLVSRTPTGIVQQRTIPVRFVPLVRPPR
jgi:protein-L-isoaspartate(D-aspartate) O-methyltransferase